MTALKPGPIDLTIDQEDDANNSGHWTETQTDRELGDWMHGRTLN